MSEKETYKFPDESNLVRIAQEQAWYNMLMSKDYGNAKMLYNKQSGKIERKILDPMIPIPATISDITSDLLFGEFPNIEVEQGNETINDAFNDFLFNTDFDTNVLELANVISAQGTGFCRFWKLDGQTYYDFVKVSETIWQEDNFQFTNVKFIESVEKQDNVNLVYEIQEHDLENGRHVLKHYRLITDATTRDVKDRVEIDPDIYTDLDFIPVVKILNQGQLGRKTGRSDYAGKEQLFSEIDNRIDQNNSLLEENADPWIGLPPGILNQNGQFNKQNGKMFERTISGNPGDNEVNIIAWGSESILPSMEHTKQMIEMCFFTSRISGPIAGLTTSEGGQAESGRALKWKSVNTLSMISRKRKYWDNFIRHFIKIWGVFEGHEIDKKGIIIAWQDGLPMDSDEMIDSTVKQVQAQIMSRETAIKKAQELELDDATAELQKINGEESARVARETVNLNEAITI